MSKFENMSWRMGEVNTSTNFLEELYEIKTEDSDVDNDDTEDHDDEMEDHDDEMEEDYAACVDEFHVKDEDVTSWEWSAYSSAPMAPRSNAFPPPSQRSRSRSPMLIPVAVKREADQTDEATRVAAGEPPRKVLHVSRKRRTRSQHTADEARQTKDESDATGDSESESEYDTFFDAIDRSGNPLLKGGDLRFEWSLMNNFRGEEEPFRAERTGSVETHETPYQAFRSYWDDHILEHIVTQVNLYATKIKGRGFQSKWVPTNVHEILCLFSFWMMLGIIRMPTIRSCFSTNPLLKTSVFRKNFTLTRYKSLVRALHFVDTVPDSFASTSVNGPGRVDRLYHLRPILDHLNAKFKANYILDKNITINEGSLWKGLVDIKQYIRKMAASFGIQTYELCESRTGYVWSFLVYTDEGHNLDSPAAQSRFKPIAIVNKLLEPLLNKGHRLFMDNWFNSPLLARFLKRNGTDFVGTLRSSHVDVHPIIHKADLKQGQFVATHCGDVCVITHRQERKKVSIISTCHGTAIGLSRVLSNVPVRNLPKYKLKPQVILDYEAFMGGIDSRDHILEPYLLEGKRSKKLYIRLFKRLLNCSILNARILLESSSEIRQENSDFRLRIVDNILANHLSLCPASRKANIHVSGSTRLTNNTHWPVRIGGSERDVRNRWRRVRCVRCINNGKKNQFTAVECKACQVPLCPVPCFKAHHIN